MTDAVRSGCEKEASPRIRYGKGHVPCASADAEIERCVRAKGCGSAFCKHGSCNRMC